MKKKINLLNMGLMPMNTIKRASVKKIVGVKTHMCDCDETSRFITTKNFPSYISVRQIPLVIISGENHLEKTDEFEAIEKSVYFLCPFSTYFACVR